MCDYFIFVVRTRRSWRTLRFAKLCRLASRFDVAPLACLLSVAVVQLEVGANNHALSNAEGHWHSMPDRHGQKVGAEKNQQADRVDG